MTAYYLIMDCQALLDVHAIDTGVPSYVLRSVAAILAVISRSRKEGKKYNNAANARRASFTPFVVSVDGALGRSNLLS